VAAMVNYYIEIISDLIVVLLEDRPDKGDRCADPAYLYGESSEDNDHPACKVFLERPDHQLKGEAHSILSYFILG
jgi:hypothetical protein